MTDQHTTEPTPTDDSTGQDRGTGNPGTDRAHLQDVAPTQVDERAVAERLDDPETDAAASVDETTSPDTTDEHDRPVENPSG